MMNGRSVPDSSQDSSIGSLDHSDVSIAGSYQDSRYAGFLVASQSNDIGDIPQTIDFLECRGDFSGRNRQSPPLGFLVGGDSDERLRIVADQGFQGLLDLGGQQRLDCNRRRSFVGFDRELIDRRILADDPQSRCVIAPCHRGDDAGAFERVRNDGLIGSDNL